MILQLMLVVGLSVLPFASTFAVLLSPKHECFAMTSTPTTEDFDVSSKKRRSYVASSIIILLPWQFEGDVYAKETVESITDIKRIASYISKEVDPLFLSNVIKSNNNFLYRGLSSEQSKATKVGRRFAAAIILKDEPFDLLDASTYESNEAAAYFQSLEEELTTLKPSNSHIGTTCPKEAAKWGHAASIWPLGEKGVEFAWLADGGTFWPISDGTSNTKKRTIISSSSSAKQNHIKGKELSDALQGDAWDIMFRADNGFLAVPIELDEELRAYLMKMQ